MKDYEKVGVGIGVVALGFAAYQAYKTKQAADATEATDPSRNPIKAAIELTENVIKGTASWFTQTFDEGTGRVKGGAETIINTITAVPYAIFYATKGAIDKGLGAAEAGTKYIWSQGAKIAKSGKTQLEQLTNKPFTLMGSIPNYLYSSSRENIPSSSVHILNSLTGAGSGLIETTKKNSTEVINYAKGLIPPWMRRK